MPLTIITGGSGLIGRSLTKHLTSRGHDVIIFSREEKESKATQVTFKKWDPESGLIDTAAVSKADFIINLAGAGVMDKPWTENYKKEILDSRVKSGELLSKTLISNDHQLKAFISASAIGWYGEDKNELTHSYGFIESDPPAKTFLGETCLLWEDSVTPIEQAGIRLVKLRFGIVLSNNGGAFPEFKKSLQYGVASILGNGKQIVSWIHIDDLCRMIIFAMKNEAVRGVYNAVAPEPVRNKEFILETAKKLKKKFFVPMHVPKLIIEWMMGTRSVEILKSTKVNCKKIKTVGFGFTYPTIKSALDELASSSS